MKKLFALLAVVLAVASCQKESNDLAVNMGEQETLITVALPEATRANSALGGLDNNVRADHQLRYILEIYSDIKTDECLRNVKFAEGEKTEVVFNVRLVPGHAYDFVVWADFVKNGEDTYFDTKDGLDAIKMINLDAMTEARDAYYNVVSIEAGEPVSKVNTITLTRPFAKVRVVADDVDEAKAALHNSLTEATVTYTDDVVVYNTFNARTQDVSVTGEVSKEKTFSYTTSAYDKSNLYVDYLLVPQDGQSNVKFDLNVEGFVNRAFKTDIAVEANKLTTIKGNILTNGSDITVDVNDDFVSETIYLEGDVTLTEDLVIDRPMVVRKGATAVLDLNGFNITNKTKNDAYGEDEAIIVYGNLTIKGQGTVTANSMAVWARGAGGKAVVNIEGGTYKGCAEGFAFGGRSVIYASGNNTINIYDGTFESLTADVKSYANKTEGVFAALNVADYNAKTSTYNGHINVYGGRFYKQNPAAPGTEPAAWNALHPNGFLAEGYRVEPDSDWFNVIYDPYYGYTKVTTADELVEALMNKASVKFANDIKIDPANMSNAYGKTGINVKYGQTIDGAGYTLNIKGAGGTWDSGINTTGGLIKNLTVTGSFRGIFINHNSENGYSEKVVLENVTLGGNGMVYTISCDQGMDQTFEATNCTFNGWTSYAKTAGEAKFIRCAFGEGSGHKYCRPYSNTVFVNCTFCPD